MKKVKGGNMKNKKALSDVVTTVLIVLLALAAIAIVWGFVRPIFSQAGSSATITNKCLNTELSPTVCIYTNTSEGPSGLTFDTTVSLIRAGTDGAEKMKVVIYDEDDETIISDSDSAPSEVLQTAKITGIQPGDTSLDNSTTYQVQAIPVFLDSEGNDALCPASPTKIPCVPA